MMVSRLLIDGKKNLAARLFYDSLDHIRGLQMSAGANTTNKTSPGGGSPVSGTSQNSRAKKNSSSSGSATKNKGETLPVLEGKDLVDSRAGSLTEASSNSADALKLFQQAIVNVTPVVEVKSRRVGGSNFQVPLEVSSERGTALALKWIVQAARQRPGREMAIKLANELMDASNKTGNAIRKREETHRNAEANKAFANYRF
jgi:ribosomal protein S7